MSKANFVSLSLVLFFLICPQTWAQSEAREQVHLAPKTLGELRYAEDEVEREKKEIQNRQLELEQQKLKLLCSEKPLLPTEQQRLKGILEDEAVKSISKSDFDFLKSLSVRFSKPESAQMISWEYARGVGRPNFGSLPDRLGMEEIRIRAAINKSFFKMILQYHEKNLDK